MNFTGLDLFELRDIRSLGMRPKSPNRGWVSYPDGGFHCTLLGLYLLSLPEAEALAVDVTSADTMTRVAEWDRTR